MDVSTNTLVWLLMATAVVGSLVLSRALRVPYPSLLVAVGLALGFIPGTPVPRLAPELVFFVFLPPLVYAAAFLSSPRELFEQRRPIGLLAVGLVGITLGAVAAVVHALVPGLGWAPALVLGAILAPTDPIAATAVLDRVGAPARLRNVLEGESLVNDGIALVAFGLALEAVSKTVSAPDIALRLVVVVLGGAAVGIAIGWIVAHIRARLDDPPIEIAISLLTPYAAYLPAERAHVSGVLAVVACGLFLGWRSPGIFLPHTRLQATAFWAVFTFILESALFVLIGLQFGEIVDSLEDIPAARLVGYALAVCVVVIGLRIALVLGVPALTRFAGAHRDRGRPFSREQLVIAWSGMRGGISLAAALAIPLAVAGEPFPRRDLIVFLTFCVILATLVLQGATLTPLVSWLGIGRPVEEERREIDARRRMAHAALAALDQHASGEAVDEEIVNALRDVYELRIRRLDDQLSDGGAVRQEPVEGFRKLRRHLIAAERKRLNELRDEGAVGEADVRDLERELDLEESRIDA